MTHPGSFWKHELPHGVGIKWKVDERNCNTYIFCCVLQWKKFSHILIFLHHVWHLRVLEGNVEWKQREREQREEQRAATVKFSTGEPLSALLPSIILHCGCALGHRTLVPLTWLAALSLYCSSHRDACTFCQDHFCSASSSLRGRSSDVFLCTSGVFASRFGGYYLHLWQWSPQVHGYRCPFTHVLFPKHKF